MIISLELSNIIKNYGLEYYFYIAELAGVEARLWFVDLGVDPQTSIESRYTSLDNLVVAFHENETKFLGRPSTAVMVIENADNGTVEKILRIHNMRVFL